MTDQIAELRRLLAEATPGPWSVCDCTKLCKVWSDDDQAPVLGDACRRDRDLIVAAVNALPALLDELERLRAENETLRVAANMPTGVEAARAVLCTTMSEISEEYYCAWWLNDLEFSLWEIISGGDRHFGLGELTDYEVLRLAELSKHAGGWFRWVGSGADSGPEFVPLAEWQEVYKARAALSPPEPKP